MLFTEQHICVLYSVRFRMWSVRTFGGRASSPRHGRRDANQMSRPGISKHKAACLLPAFLHSSPQACTLQKAPIPKPILILQFLCFLSNNQGQAVRVGEGNSRETSEAFKQFRSGDSSYLHSVITESFHNLRKLFTHVQKLLSGAGRGGRRRRRPHPHPRPRDLFRKFTA